MSTDLTVAPNLAVVTAPEVRQLVASAIRSNTDSLGNRHTGVIGLRARCEWTGPAEFIEDGVPVRVRVCESALAVRAELRDRPLDSWLVIITDREESDLGAGILAYLHNQALRTPDPWNAVREQFAADRIDRRLVTHPSARQLASELLAARGDQPWLPARGGLLTYDHVFGSVVARWLDLGHAADPVTEDVLRWSAKESAGTSIADLRNQVGDHLARATLEWLAARCGGAANVVNALIDGNAPEDLVPLGLAGRALLACPDGSEPWGRLPGRLGVDEVTRAELTPLVEAAERVVRDLVLDDNDVSRRQVGRLLTRADVLVTELKATAGIEESLLLHGSLASRLRQLGVAIQQAVETAESRARAQGPTAPLVEPARVAAVEAGYARVQEHLLSRQAKEVRVPRALAAVRLVRWLSQELVPAGPARDLAVVMQRHRDDEAWVDRAYGDVWRGVDVPDLDEAMAAVVRAVRLRRERHDLEFATALAAFTENPASLPDDVVVIEELVARVVVPLARQQPVLLVIADGMSAAVGTEIVDDIEGHYDSWTECVPGGSPRRMAAVAALPSLTEVSRCSLLSGTLATGQQAAERDGFAGLMRAHGLTSALFHKLNLDSSGAGTDLAPDVRSAVENIDGVQVVACVLNTIDDALDRSDPGIDWTTDAVAHLRPLMERARRAGRLVVLTSDHGHVIERREGRTQSAPVISSNRSRPFDGAEVGPAEVRVRGSRVLKHDGDAVLAVDERLRYGPLKAGYHGGASPAEVVVPIHVLTPGDAPDGWHLAPPQVPAWWQGVVSSATGAAPAPVAPVQLPATDLPTLFDTVEPTAPAAADDLASRVVASATYSAQRERSARFILADERVEALLRVMLAAPGHRVDPSVAATALGINKVQVAGAVPMLQRLLNIEQYPVLDRDPDGQTLVLDPDLLAEQFGVPR